MPENIFTGSVAHAYDASAPEMFTPEVLDVTTAFLADAASGGGALEFAIGTGRVALPLSARGVEVTGIDISEDMIAELRAKPGASAIATSVGDFATTTVPGRYALVYLVFNTISNLLHQHETVQCFRNAAHHLAPGGRFVIELNIPNLRSFPPGASALAFDVRDDHVGFDLLDTATQRVVSNHFFTVGDRIVRFDSPHRYAWPAELDLMAEIAGLSFVERWADWDRSPFTSESTKHISVWQRPEA